VLAADRLDFTLGASLASRAASQEIWRSRGYTWHVVRRISVTSVLLGLGSVFGVTLALGAAGVHRERIHVTPTVGSADTVFVVSFTVPERTGLYFLAVFFRPGGGAWCDAGWLGAFWQEGLVVGVRLAGLGLGLTVD
jgi:hypothetical protein